MSRKCHRQRSLIRSIGHGAGPTTWIPLGQLLREVSHLRVGPSGHHDVGQSSVRWVAGFQSIGELLLRKPLVVVLHGRLEREVSRSGRLHEDFPRLGAPAGSPRHLGEELEGAFAGPEVRKVEADVGVDDPDQRDVGKIEPLRDHLRSEQDVHLSAANPLEDAEV